MELLNTQCALHDEETRQRDFVQFYIYFLHFFAWFCQQTQSLLQKQKHNRNNKVETALMNENAGGQTCRQKQTRALSPHCKNANANCKFQLERNSLVSALLSQKLQSPHPSHSHLRCFWERNVRAALSVCVFYVVIAFHDTNSNGLCSATHCVASWKAERGVGWWGSTHQGRRRRCARVFCVRVYVCLCVCCVGYFIFYNFLLLFCILFNLLTHNNSHYFLFLFYTRFGFAKFPRMRNRNTRTKNDDDFRMLLLL